MLGAETTRRGVPDVAMNAGFNASPAALFYATADTVVDGKHEGVIGTSLSSPLAMGVFARLQAAHCGSLGFAAPLFYALDTAGGPLSTATGFHDIIVGTNGGYAASPGWDYNTGFGTFDIPLVNAALPKATCALDNPPLAVLNASAVSGNSPLKVDFNAAGSSDPDAGDSLTYYVLDFGDGTPAISQTTPTFAEHDYDAPGTYTASLTVRDTHGLSNVLAAVKQIVVNGVPLNCTAPGPVLLTSPAGNPSLEGVDPQMGNGSDDLLSTSIAEPVELDNKLVVTMKMVSLATLPTAYRWVTYFTANGSDYYVSMSTADGVDPTYTYGAHGVSAAGTGTFDTLGTLDATSGYNVDGTITLVLDKSLIPLKPGDKLTAISTSVRTATPDAATAGTPLPGGTGLTVDSAGAPNPYLIISHNACLVSATGPAVPPGTSTTPVTGTTPVSTITPPGTVAAPVASSDGRFGGGAMGLGLLPLLLVAARRRQKTRV